MRVKSSGGSHHELQRSCECAKMDMVHDGAAHEHHRHGSLGGHVLPGAFFIIWSVWWFVNISSIYIHRAQRKKAYAAQPHYRLSVAPAFPFEAVIKISLCTLGILGELYLSHHAHWRCATLPAATLQSATIHPSLRGCE